ncbi:MAG: heme-binding protein [Sphingosinicella sp.]|uniref:heme-binding protein n=1 Tax=Sphingosinicella sp. TaxID=1917971 RepID=UPI004037657B
MKILAAATGLLCAAGALAQQAPARLDARAAQAIVAGCVAHAEGRQQSFGIAVVDAGGHPVAILRMDRNGFGMMEFALAKARAAAAWGFSTADMVDGARATPGFAAASHVVTVAGGVPVWSADGRARLGAVGVSGGAPAADAACAEAGIAAAGLRSQRGG